MIQSFVYLSDKMYLFKLYKPHVKLNQESLKVARMDLREDPNLIDKHVEFMKNWLLKQNHFKSKMTADFIIRFLRVAKYDCAKAQVLIENYWVTRMLYKDFFNNRQFLCDRLVSLANAGICVPMPYLDSQRRRILISRVGEWDTKKYTYKDILKYTIRCIEALCEDPICQIHGVRFFSFTF
jgi:hypothetical protein